MWFKQRVGLASLWQGLPRAFKTGWLAMQALGFPLERADGSGLRLTETLLAAPAHAEAKRLLAHWRSRAAEGGLIVGRDLPSRALAGMLSGLALFEYRIPEEDFRAKLAGFNFVRRFGHDISGKFLREVTAKEDHQRHRDMMQRVLREGVPVSLDTKLKGVNRLTLHCETVLLGVLAADGATPLVLSGLFFFEPARKGRS